MRKLNRYDIENAETLKKTYRPFATKVSEVILDESVPEVDVNRTMVDCIIKLEDEKLKLQEELLMYKMTHGNLRSDVW
jgi:hypothetical protein